MCCSSLYLSSCHLKCNIFTSGEMCLVGFCFGAFVLWEVVRELQERNTDTFLCSCGSLPPCLLLSFLTPLAAALLYPKKIPGKVTFTSCCSDRDFMACQPRVSLLNSTCAALQVPTVLSCLFHQRQMTTGNLCVLME